MSHEIAAEPVIEAPFDEGAARAKRKKGFVALAAVVLVLGGSWYAYDTLVASRHVTTDNAYVGANVAQVTSLLAAPVTEVLVDDAQTVKKGDILLRLDDTDAKLALAQAEAALAAAERRVRGMVATDGGLAAQVAARAADRSEAAARLSAAKGDWEKAKLDLQRRQTLAQSGSVSGEELSAAQNAVTTAAANLRAAEAAQALTAANQSAAEGSRLANAALIDNTTPQTHPEVQAARAARDQAQVNLNRTIVRAPVDGVVSRRQVQVGQRVQPGVPLMLVVPLRDAFVDANFKEVQLAKVKPGQKVELYADLYGKSVKYTGTVVGFAGGTGSAFSVIPAQNASGNWIKVVQRLPVRIKLDPAQLAEHPLRVGLSMHVDIALSE